MRTNNRTQVLSVTRSAICPLVLLFSPIVRTRGLRHAALRVRTQASEAGRERLSFARARHAGAAASPALLLTLLVVLVLAWFSPSSSPASISPARGRSMWIWYVSRSDGGSIPAIISRARAAGVRTLIVKSSDGGHSWSQFNSSLVQQLRASGLHVCAWQYVYGTEPLAEADAGARAVSAG